MIEPETVTWPEGWVVSREKNASNNLFSVRVDLNNYGIYQSGGNEKLWYVVQYWLGSPEEHDTDITGQCTTLEGAVECLKTWLAGGYVPDGDEIVVRVGEKSTGYMPIFHNRRGEKYVAISEVI
jgi:hypothetical protein